MPLRDEFPDCAAPLCKAASPAGRIWVWTVVLSTCLKIEAHRPPIEQARARGLVMTRIYGACLLLMLSVTAMFLFNEQVRAQCAPYDVMRRNPGFIASSSGTTQPAPIETAAGTKVWKSIQVGTFASKTALYKTFEDADCGIGDTADEILVAPEFRLSGVATKIDLVAASVSELGMTHENATLKDIYARAQELGFVLAAAEVGPQLRLQYLDQPMGEFLEIAMAPIRTRDGAFRIFTVVNGGAGLLLLGENASDDATFYLSSRFVFVRQRDVAEMHQ